MRVLGLLCLLLLPLSLQAEQGQDPSAIPVGAVLSLTGDVAFAGAAIREGMELALKVQPKPALRIIFEDDESLNRVKTVSAAKRLIEIDKVPVIFSTAVNNTTAIAGHVNAKQVLNFVVWDSNERLAELGDYVFGFGYRNEYAGEDVAAYATEQRGLRSLSVIIAQDEWSQIVGAAFRKGAEARGGQILMFEQVPAETHDFRALIARLVRNGTSGVYVPLLPGPLVSFVRQARELGYRGYILTGDGFGQNEMAALGPQLSERIVFTQAWSAQEELAKLYSTHMGKTADSMHLGFVALGYDAVQYLQKLIQHTYGKKLPVTGKTLREIALRVGHVGASGTTNFSRGRVGEKREPVLVVFQGKPVVVQR